MRHALFLLLLFPSLACTRHTLVNATPLDIHLSAPAQEETRYVIQPGDELEIRLFHTPEQNVILPVRPDGYISIPLANEVRAAGRTPDELRVELQAAMARELKDPEVAVIVRTFTAYKVHVGGLVEAPGVFELNGARTALQAIFEAGGFRLSASPEDAFVIRRAPEGGYILVPINLEQALTGEDLTQNLMLRPFDAIYVPRAPIANLNRWIELYVRRNLPFDLNGRVDI